MRQLVQKRKERLQIEQEREMAAADAARVKEEESERRRVKKEKEKNGKKRSAEEMEGVEEESGERGDSLPSVGAHGVARQDGVGVGEGEFSQSRVHMSDKNKFMRPTLTCY